MQVAFPRPDRRFSPDTVALHFIRSLRDHLDDPSYVAEARRVAKTGEGDVARLKAIPATIDDLFWGSLTRIRRIFRPDRPPWQVA